MEEEKKGKVLVTGITGFVGSYLGKLLLEKGYFVRGTVRSKHNEKKIKPLQALEPADHLELVEADLLEPKAWDEAVKGCTMVAHVASPFPMDVPKDAKLLIRTATEGTLNVLKACAAHKEVKAVVVTSSISAIVSFGKHMKDELTEKDWANVTTLTPYAQSKTLAEKAAWDFYNSLDKTTRFRMSVINPGAIMGPSLISTEFSSGEIIRQILSNQLTAIPWIGLSIVDVRDVAVAHIAALELPKSDGQRYICVSDGNIWFEQVVEILREEFAKYGYQITRTKIKYCFVRAYAIISSTASNILPLWGKNPLFINEKIKKDLGMKFIPTKEAILELAHSLIRNKMVPDLINKKK